MNKQEKLTAEREESTTARIAIRNRKPYEKPRVVYQAPLEAMASACGTFPGKASVNCGTPQS